jgi:hypothetical protein
MGANAGQIRQYQQKCPQLSQTVHSACTIIIIFAVAMGKAWRCLDSLLAVSPGSLVILAALHTTG